MGNGAPKNAATAPLVYFDNVPVFGTYPATSRSSSPRAADAEGGRQRVSDMACAAHLALLAAGRHHADRRADQGARHVFKQQEQPSELLNSLVFGPRHQTARGNYGVAGFKTLRQASSIRRNASPTVQACIDGSRFAGSANWTAVIATKRDRAKGLPHHGYQGSRRYRKRDHRNRTEIAGERMGIRKTPSWTSGDRSMEEMGEGLEGQHEAEDEVDEARPTEAEGEGESEGEPSGRRKPRQQQPQRPATARRRGTEAAREPPEGRVPSGKLREANERARGGSRARCAQGQIEKSGGDTPR
jgi:hypothetical protein